MHKTSGEKNFKKTAPKWRSQFLLSYPYFIGETVQFPTLKKTRTFHPSLERSADAVEKQHLNLIGKNLNRTLRP